MHSETAEYLALCCLLIVNSDFFSYEWGKF